MTVLPVVNHRRFIGAYELNITARLVGVDEAKYMTALIVHTTRAYVYLTKLIEAGAVKVPDTHNVSAEVAVGGGYVFEPFTETRVTVFCWNHKIDLTLHSSDTPQQALDLYYAMEGAKAELTELYKPSETAPNATNSSAAPQVAMTTPEPAKTAQNGVVRVIGWKAAKELAPGSMFTSPIAKIEAAMDKKGILTWELFCPYGGNPGKYKDFTVFSDNEHTAALSQMLTEMCGKAGTALTGNWVASGNVTESKGKKYVNILDLVQA